MKTRLLLVAASVLLGGAYVAAQVESPSEPEAAQSPEEVSASTSTVKPEDEPEGGAFENAASTSTYERPGMEERFRERGAVEDDAGTDSEIDSGSDSGSETDAEPESKTRPQKP